MKSLLRDIASVILIASVVIFGLQLTAQKFIIDGPSMNDSFEHGQQILVNKLAYRFGEPQRGDVLVFLPPDDIGEEYIKRIIGLPGEYVIIKDGEVFVHQPDGNVIVLDEPYVSEQINNDYLSDIIPFNHYLMLGDNRNNSSDSRNGWTLPIENVIGKAWLSVWPPDRWGLVENVFAAR